jgi:hypothetical protein
MSYNMMIHDVYSEIHIQSYTCNTRSNNPWDVQIDSHLDSTSQMKFLEILEDI